MLRVRLALVAVVLSLLSLAMAGGADFASQARAAPLVRRVPPLTTAVLKRDLAQLRRLLDAGEDPERKDCVGCVLRKPVFARKVTVHLLCRDLLGDDGVDVCRNSIDWFLIGRST
jgi:hypothetical protein